MVEFSLSFSLYILYNLHELDGKVSSCRNYVARERRARQRVYETEEQRAARLQVEDAMRRALRSYRREDKKASAERDQNRGAHVIQRAKLIEMEHSRPRRNCLVRKRRAL